MDQETSEKVSVWIKYHHVFLRREGYWVEHNGIKLFAVQEIVNIDGTTALSMFFLPENAVWPDIKSVLVANEDEIMELVEERS